MIKVGIASQGIAQKRLMKANKINGAVIWEDKLDLNCQN